MRAVKACATCRFVEDAGYYSEFYCLKFPEGDFKRSVRGFAICDAYEECDKPGERLNSAE